VYRCGRTLNLVRHLLRARARSSKIFRFFNPNQEVHHMKTQFNSSVSEQAQQNLLDLTYLVNGELIGQLNYECYGCNDLQQLVGYAPYYRDKYCEHIFSFEIPLPLFNNIKPEKWLNFIKTKLNKSENFKGCVL
jgi:hypothetical protein